MNTWMNSPGHRANILSTSFTHMGSGIAWAQDGTPYFTQDFVGDNQQHSFPPCPKDSPGSTAPIPMMRGTGVDPNTVGQGQMPNWMPGVATEQSLAPAAGQMAATAPSAVPSAATAATTPAQTYLLASPLIQQYTPVNSLYAPTLPMAAQTLPMVYNQAAVMEEWIPTVGLLL